jgi:hypothetical protein
MLEIAYMLPLMIFGENFSGFFAILLTQTQCTIKQATKNEWGAGGVNAFVPIVFFVNFFGTRLLKPH